MAPTKAKKATKKKATKKEAKVKEKTIPQNCIKICIQRSTGKIIDVYNESNGKSTKTPTNNPFPVTGGVNKAGVIIWYQNNPTCFWYRGKRYCV